MADLNTVISDGVDVLEGLRRQLIAESATSKLALHGAIEGLSAYERGIKTLAAEQARQVEQKARREAKELADKARAEAERLAAETRAHAQVLKDKTEREARERAALDFFGAPQAAGQAAPKAKK